MSLSNQTQKLIISPHPPDTFADDALIDRIKITVGDPTADARLKRKILSVLAGWSRQFRDDPKMASVAGLYAACGGGSAAGKRVGSTYHSAGRVEEILIREICVK